MMAVNIDFDYFVSLDCFFDEFVKRYYNTVVTCVDNYKELLVQLQSMNFNPEIYVIMRNGKIEESLPFNVQLIKNYDELIKLFQEK